MVDDSSKVAPDGEAAHATAAADSGAADERERREREEREGSQQRQERAQREQTERSGISDIVRVAATEMRGWLEHLNFSDEIAKTLSKMVIELKTEIRFRATEDGKLV